MVKRAEHERRGERDERDGEQPQQERATRQRIRRRRVFLFDLLLDAAAGMSECQISTGISSAEDQHFLEARCSRTRRSSPAMPTRIAPRAVAG